MELLILQLMLTFTDAKTLNNAIAFTAKTYHEIGQLHAEQVGCSESRFLSWK